MQLSVNLIDRAYIALDLYNKSEVLCVFWFICHDISIYPQVKAFTEYVSHIGFTYVHPEDMGHPVDTFSDRNMNLKKCAKQNKTGKEF